MPLLVGFRSVELVAVVPPLSFDAALRLIRIHYGHIFREIRISCRPCETALVTRY
jgi:hypothetical protein